VKTIVVGIDDIAQADALIDWVTRFAPGHATAVEFLQVVDTAANGPITDAMLGADETRLRERADAVAEALPGVAVTARVAVGSPVNQLVGAADSAGFLVIGSRLRRRDESSRRALRLTTLARCSVIIIPTDQPSAGNGVVVGVDGAVESEHAVQFAADLAAQHSERLLVVHAREGGRRGRPQATGSAAGEDTARRAISDSIVGLDTRYPDLVVETLIRDERPDVALKRSAAGCRMLVVGSRSRHGLAHSLLGSVSETLVGELPAPMAVIRPTP
jgi:nucleotide-binding universal stress UspA family protein